MKKLLYPLAVMALAFAGCTTYHTERGAQALEEPASVGATGYYTHWQVGSQKVMASSSASILFGIFSFDEGKEAEVPGFMSFSIFPTDRAIYSAKAAATYNACTASKADAVLGAIYNYKVTNYFYLFHTVECSITGFPATMTGVEMLQERPWILKSDEQLIRLKAHEVPAHATGKTNASAGGSTGAFFGLF